MKVPEVVLNSLKMEAYYLYCELEKSELKVILVDAPDQRHYHHKIRMVASRNVQWWSDLYQSYLPRKLDKKTFLKALQRFYRTGKLKYKLDYKVWDLVISMSEDPIVRIYFETGIPF